MPPEKTQMPRPLVAPLPLVPFSIEAGCDNVYRWELSRDQIPLVYGEGYGKDYGKGLVLGIENE